ncbi:MAG: NTP transferase domain-containing protein [Planctomycetales bacterium]|nr:NTP transferase domain-containing protein [Planctomycetales bacterium]
MKAGIVLCGGKSSRMGLPKAWLPFGPETMLQRIVHRLRPAVDRMIVVAAAGQKLPALADEVTVVRDQRPERGPLEGLAAGLAACSPEVEAAYATSCDVPFLVPQFASRLFALIGQHQIAVPFDGRYHHPLAAVYRTSVQPQIEDLLGQDKLRPAFLFDLADTLRVAPAAWSDVDPQGATLQNLNRPEDYLQAMEQAGFEVPPDIARQLAQPPMV